MLKWMVLGLQNKSKTSKIVGVIAVGNEYTSKIQGQDMIIRPLLDSNTGYG